MMSYCKRKGMESFLRNFNILLFMCPYTKGAGTVGGRVLAQCLPATGETRCLTGAESWTTGDLAEGRDLLLNVDE